MKRGFIFLGLILILSSNFISSSTYYLEFNQADKEIFVVESINGSQNLSYKELDTLNFAGNEIYFLKKVIFPENFDKAIIRLNLEKGIIVKNSEIFPINYKIETDGEIIFITWTLNNVKKAEAFAIFVNLEETKKESLFFIFVFLFLLILGVFLLVFLKIFHKKNTLKKSKKVKIKTLEKYEYLLDSEKKLIEELKKAKRNELWQRQVQSLTGFSKAKVSRLVRNLESRGLIRKISFGNTNKLRLK